MLPKFQHGIKAKKHLGQHFLKDVQICAKIAHSLVLNQDENVLEIGPGAGALTTFLQELPISLWLSEVDTESIVFLKDTLHVSEERILGDFLQVDLQGVNPGQWSIIGNFPYHISTQILFRIYEQKDKVNQAVGMFQKEVAERVVAKSGSRTYGILSVLMQAYYDIEYLFTLNEDAFIPPPKVKSGVIRLVRNKVEKLPCDEAFFKVIVKVAFNQRRKTLRNALKSILPPNFPTTDKIWDLRAEALNVADYILLANQIKPQ
jgi:16S rRNA (adenine1518-N6/adenine1519-N6)-dimethyltransferase